MIAEQYVLIFQKSLNQNMVLWEWLVISDHALGTCVDEEDEETVLFTSVIVT